jgi:outer membrane receptor protein involved in Fe transport
MLPIRLLIVLLLLLPTVTLAQSTNLTGRILDSENQALSFATVALFQANDSSITGGIIADENGRFVLEVKPGTYLVQIKMLSYQEKWIDKLEVGKQGLSLGDIVLESESVDLDEVEITAQSNQMVLKLDKRVFNVGSDLNNTARNASEILDNVPSVTVDMDGNVALRGSQNVRILIDGKPSGLVGTGTTDALRQLPGNMIESVEVITNPSSRYDAEGEVGIINIVLKKEKRSGVNGVFELTGGIPHNHRASYSLNWRKKSFNLFSNFALTYRNSPGGGNSSQIFFPDIDSIPDSTKYVERTRIHRRGGWGQALTLGSDFFLGPRSTLTVSGLVNRSVGDNFAELTYSDFNFENINTENTIRVDDETERQRVIESGVSFLHTFPQKDRKWSVDLKFVDSDDIETSDIVQNSDIETTELIQRSYNAENEQTWFFQTDYVHPFGSKDSTRKSTGKFETGYRSNIRYINNIYTVEQLDETINRWDTLADFDNNFIYLENIHAVYLQASNQTGKFSYMGGLRAEYTDLSTELVKSDTTNPRSYLNLFPSVFLSYELSKTSTVQLNYSRRLSRPRFRDLLPFTSFSDPRNFRAGNPDLNPEFTHSFEAGYLQYFEKGSLLSSVYYRNQTGVIQRVTLEQFTDSSDIPILLSQPINLAEKNSYGLEMNLSYDLLKWWKVNGNFNFFRAITRGGYEGQNFDADAITWTARASSKMSIPRFADFQLTFDYRGPQNLPQGRSLAMWSLDGGLSRDILKKKGTLTLSVRDVFNTRRWRSLVDQPGFTSVSDFQWRARQFQLSFVYRLNQTKSRGERGEGGGDGGGDF